tara:strand:- start:853 stop:1719 length:867 start_codon:yes stop_codon:yes gene_type:complete
MVEYTCINCNKLFNHKSTYLRHINRKFKCKNIKIETKKTSTSAEYSTFGMPIPKMEYSDNICEFCNKNYSTKYNLNKHQKKCKLKKETTKKEELFQLLKLEVNKDLEKQNLFLKQQINNLQIELCNNKTTNITNNNYTNISNTNCNNKTINILAYDKTDLSHLTDKDFELIMKKCYKSVPSLIEKTHFDPLRPENKNIYISNIKQNFVMKYTGEKWILCNKDETLDELYENSSNILEDKIENWEANKYKYDKDAVDKFYKFLDNKEKDNIKNEIKDEIKLILYNNKID